MQGQRLCIECNRLLQQTAIWQGASHRANDSVECNRLLRRCGGLGTLGNGGTGRGTAACRQNEPSLQPG